MKIPIGLFDFYSRLDTMTSLNRTKRNDPVVTQQSQGPLSFTAFHDPFHVAVETTGVCVTLWRVIKNWNGIGLAPSSSQLPLAIIPLVLLIRMFLLQTAQNNTPSPCKLPNFRGTFILLHSG